MDAIADGVLTVVEQGLSEPHLLQGSDEAGFAPRPRTPSSCLADQAREDAAVWSKRWVCIGFDDEIPGTGDVLPFTVGHHGIHVERMGDGTLVGRFNKAQHGGCRVVPLQCRTGARTRCSFTACGYSWDRRPIRGDDPNRTALLDQYLGLRPERLLPVAVDTWGPLILAQLDPTNETARAWPEAVSLFAPFANSGSCDTVWRELPCDWKQAAARWTGQGATVLFPNVVLQRSDAHIGVAVLQPVALDRTLCRIRVFARKGSALDGTQTTMVADAMTASVCSDAALSGQPYDDAFSMDLAIALDALRRDPSASQMYRTDERDAW